jgi:hypothetical protein
VLAASLTLAAVPAEPVVVVAPTMITVAHWGRLDDGELFAWSRRLEWAVMMKRTYGFDALRCPRCSRRMRVIATLLEPAVVRKVLEHLGVRASPLPRAPARDPEWNRRWTWASRPRSQARRRPPPRASGEGADADVCLPTPKRKHERHRLGRWDAAGTRRRAPERVVARTKALGIPIRPSSRN